MVEVVLVNIDVDDETERVLLVNRSLVLLDEEAPGAPTPFWLLLIVAWKILFFTTVEKPGEERLNRDG